jgi:hypothetical protein
VNLKTVLADRDQHVSFVVPLKHYKNDGKSKEGKEQGEVIIRGYLEGPKAAAGATPAPAAPPAAEKPAAEKPAAAAAKEPAPASTPAAAPSTAKPSSTASAAAEYDLTKPLKLRIDQLQARDLKDKGGSWDKQDPALRITVGEFQSFDTERYVLMQRNAMRCRHIFNSRRLCAILLLYIHFWLVAQD